MNENFSKSGKRYLLANIECLWYICMRFDSKKKKYDKNHTDTHQSRVANFK